MSNATDLFPNESSEYFGRIAVFEFIKVVILEIFVPDIFRNLHISFAKSYLDVKPWSTK